MKNKTYYLIGYSTFSEFWGWNNREEPISNDYMWTRSLDSKRKLSGWTDSRGLPIITYEMIFRYSFL